jgi:hypothetical protein
LELETNLLQASQRNPASSAVLDEVLGTHNSPNHCICVSTWVSQSLISDKSACKASLGRGSGVRYEKLESLLRVAFDLRGNAEGLSLEAIQRRYGVSRRTAERMRDAIERVFPQLEQANPGELPKRWRIRPDVISNLLRLKMVPRLEWCGKDGHYETQQRDHGALTLGDSFGQSMPMRFSVHTADREPAMPRIVGTFTQRSDNQETNVSTSDTPIEQAR